VGNTRFVTGADMKVRKYITVAVKVAVNVNRSRSGTV
jgi:hypothetical protein